MAQSNIKNSPNSEIDRGFWCEKPLSNQSQIESDVDLPCQRWDSVSNPALGQILFLKSLNAQASRYNSNCLKSIFIVVFKEKNVEVQRVYEVFLCH